MVAKKQSSPKKRSRWVPDRHDIIWINCNPQIGQEMWDVHPFLVLSDTLFVQVCNRLNQIILLA